MSWCLGEMAEKLRWERFLGKRDGPGLCVPHPSAPALPGRLPLGPVPTGWPPLLNPGSYLTAREEVPRPVNRPGVVSMGVNVH